MPPVSALTSLRSAAFCAVVMCCGTAATAEAQIYSWRDARGVLVLSNMKPDSEASVTAFDVPEAPGIRTTRYAEAVHSRAFDDLIGEHAARAGVREELVRAVIQVESGFNPRAISNRGAMGLMQLMPATARDLGVRNAFDPEENVRGGVDYLRQLLDRYDGDERLALAAYNAGPASVDRHGHMVPPFRETRDYVRRVNGLAGATQAAGAAHRTPASNGQAPIWRVVEVIDGREVVKYTNIPAQH